jgi:hypothetical protein
VDDKTMIMERVIQLVSNLPHNSHTRVELTNNFINELWYTLEHPPLLYVGERFQYRMADGSYNVRIVPLSVPDHIITNVVAEYPIPPNGCCRYTLRPVGPPDCGSARRPSRPGSDL